MGHNCIIWRLSHSTIQYVVMTRIRVSWQTLLISRDVSIGATSATAVAPKFWDTLTLLQFATRGGGQVLPTIAEVAPKFLPWLRSWSITLRLFLFLCFAKLCLSHRLQQRNEWELGALQHSLLPDIFSNCLVIRTKYLFKFNFSSWLTTLQVAVATTDPLNCKARALPCPTDPLLLLWRFYTLPFFIKKIFAYYLFKDNI